MQRGRPSKLSDLLKSEKSDSPEVRSKLLAKCVEEGDWSRVHQLRIASTRDTISAISLFQTPPRRCSARRVRSSAPWFRYDALSASSLWKSKVAPSPVCDEARAGS